MSTFEETNKAANQNIHITINAFKYLKEVQKWTFFFSIIGFIGIGIILVAAIVIGFVLPTKYADQSIFVAIAYIIMAMIYVFPVKYLYGFSRKLKKALLSEDEEQLELSFKNLKSHFKFVGVVTILMMCFYGFIFIISFLGVFHGFSL
ncbi:DUF5362 family protein [Flammeovirga kamogawensis]|uniref:DUF5362 domain-containing protein n=1 Tax=Flammeovirga kamogawensis TaxID=373891 RepID=A0ABX8H284_9BACT|nr:DUF5362 family protein [Flammeovirga kamogawensis]MBB6460202.1 small-conductance mechanosensitive channel [Flammeovirga kamogawensis]QWG10014.1 hypothetical protein KM029_20240 [Flammeovirga kamogawensis]TRX65522.1 hypothetical protein EO216_23670 [Flammeovirga kamogawensis]